MQISDFQNPAERNKLILLGVLSVAAILLLWWTFFGFGGGSKPAPRAAAQPTPPAITRVNPNPASAQPVAELSDLAHLSPINYVDSLVSVPGIKRNIFVYYEPPPPTPTPSFMPTLSDSGSLILLAGLSPSNVFADSRLPEVSGDKFTPAMRVVIDNGELPTAISPQQLTTAPASLIANPGTRQVMVRSTASSIQIH